MPMKTRVTKSAILEKAIDIVRISGVDSLNARALAQALQCSTQPIFSNYSTMEELKADMIKGVYDIYCRYLEKSVSAGVYPPYKACGMGYIDFAREEPALFRLLFMSARWGSENVPASEERERLLSLLMKTIGLSKEEANLFYLEMWAYVHGIATMIATDYLVLESETVSMMLSDAYLGMRDQYQKKKQEVIHHEKCD